MGNITVQLQNVFPGNTVNVANNPYTVAANRTISVPDTTLQADLDALGPGIYPGVTVVPSYPELFQQSFKAVDLSVGTKQKFFTVKAGRKFIPTKIVLSGASTSLATASVSFGFDTNAGDVIPTATHVELTGPTLATSLVPEVGAKIGSPGDVFGIKATVTQSATVDVDVFGEYV